MTREPIKRSAQAQPLPEPQRQSGLPVPERLKQFTSRLKSNAAWMKQFLHGGK